MRKICFVVVCLLFLGIPMLWADESPKLLSVEEMHEDISSYYSAIKKMHPRLYARYTESQFDSLCVEIKRQCNQPMSVAKFNYIICKFNKFTDGHTGVIHIYDFSNQVFPWINFEKDKAYLKDDILATIEKIEIEDIFEEISSVVSWETHPQKALHSINSLLQLYLTDYYNLKSPFCCKLLNPKTGLYRDSLIHTVELEDWKKESNPSFHPTYHDAILNWVFYSEDSIAVLYYNTSDIRIISRELLAHYVESFFHEVEEKSIKYLFIDVSQNGGGSDSVHGYIYKHLKREKPFKIKTVQYATKEGAEKLYSMVEEMSIGIDKKDKNQRDSYRYLQATMKWAKKIQKKGEVEFISKGKRKKEGFDGKVYVIMGPKSYSSANSFCVSVKMGKMGVLVGESSGQYEPFSADFISDALPNSKIQYACATVFSECIPPLPTQEGFLQPDLPYPLTKPLGLDDFKEIIRLADEKR